MMQFLSSLRQRVDQLVDPHRQERIDREAMSLVSKLLAHRADFALESARRALRIATSDLTEVTAEAYRRLLQKVWADFELTAGEKRGLDWAAEKFELSVEQRRQLQWESSRLVFQRCLLAAIEHGAADSADLAHLVNVAECMGRDVSDLVHHYFLEQGEQLVAALFESLATSGDLAAEQWDRVQQLSGWLGLSKQELRAGIGPKVKRLLERLLAGARTDNRLEGRSEAAMEHISQLVGIPREFRLYVQEELAMLRALTLIEAGELPRIDALPGIDLERAETVHFHERVHYRPLRHAGLPAPETTLIGSGFLTNKRLIIKAPSQSMSIHHEYVLGLKQASHGIEVLTPQGVGLYDFGARNRLALILYAKLVKAPPPPQPLISAAERDVAWSRDEGCCALCHLDHYLEFVRMAGRASTRGPVHVLCAGCLQSKIAARVCGAGSDADEWRPAERFASG